MLTMYTRVCPPLHVCILLDLIPACEYRQFVKTLTHHSVISHYTAMGAINRMCVAVFDLKMTKASVNIVSNVLLL